VTAPCPAITLRTLWTLLVRTVRDADDDRVLGLASEVAFYALCALPPTLLAILGAAGFVGDALGPDVKQGLVSYVVDSAANFLSPATAQDVVKPTVETVLREGRADVFSIGLLVALWSASSSAYVVLEALIIAYDVEVKRSLLRKRAKAMVFTAVGLVGAAVLLPLLVAGPRLGLALVAPLGLASGFTAVWRAIYWPAVVLISVLVLTGLYHYAVPWKTPFLRDLPGALLAVGLWLVASIVLRRYVLWTMASSSVYGSLGAPIVLLTWLYLTALAVLIGAELNAEIEKMWPTVTKATGTGLVPAGQPKRRRKAQPEPKQSPGADDSGSLD
jgi:membrane protein